MSHIVSSYAENFIASVLRRAARQIDRKGLRANMATGLAVVTLAFASSVSDMLVSREVRCHA